MIVANRVHNTFKLLSVRNLADLLMSEFWSDKDPSKLKIINKKYKTTSETKLGLGLTLGA